MNRTKLFVENFYLFGIINMLHKIIPIIILPILTRLLPDPTDFGVFEIFNVISGIVCVVAMMGFYSAIFREYFEKEDQTYKYNVTSTAYYLICSSSFCLCLLLFCFQGFLASFFPTNINLIQITILLITVIFTATNLEYFRLLSRVLNQRKVILISGLLIAGVDKLLAITFILLGLKFYGLIYALLATNIITLLYFWIINKKNVLSGKFDKKIAKALLTFGLPLLPVGVFILLNQSVNRFLILQYLDFSQLGIFSIGARVAFISNFIYIAFHTGWGYFAFSTMKDSDYKELMSKLFSLLFAVCTAFYVILFLFKNIIFNIFFTGDYILGVSVFPYLLINPLILIFISIMENQMLVKKKSIFSPFIYGFGFIINVSLSFILIPKLGIIGAAIATLSGFVVSFLLFFILVVNIKKLIIIDRNTLIMIFLFTALFAFINYSDLNPFSIFTVLCYLSIITFFYYKQVIYFYRRWKEK